jgi:hypothetical protein
MIKNKKDKDSIEINRSSFKDVWFLKFKTCCVLRGQAQHSLLQFDGFRLAALNNKKLIIKSHLQ